MSQEYEQQKIMQVDLEREMKKSYIDYAKMCIRDSRRTVRCAAFRRISRRKQHYSG